LAPKFLAEALRKVPQTSHPDLIVGFNHADDAGVYKISDDIALVQTVDFFPPIVDDPYQFGLIAAANALSDIYAMGGKPLTALNIVGFPANLPASILTDILRGGAEKVEEAGAIIIGGHSINDRELKYGIAITGIVDPEKVITNVGAQADDQLYLTKPLGIGLITTGIKRNAVSEEQTQMVINLMAELNRRPAELMVKYHATAATDVTGYGLLGHTFELADGSQKTIRIFSDRLPLLPDALKLAEAGMIPGGALANRQFMENRYLMANKIDNYLEDVLFDPQTSGGLLICIPQKYAESFERELKDKDIFAKHIGQVEAQEAYPLIIV